MISNRKKVELLTKAGVLKREDVEKTKKLLEAMTELESLSFGPSDRGMGSALGGFYEALNRLRATCEAEKQFVAEYRETLEKLKPLEVEEKPKEILDELDGRLRELELMLEASALNRGMLPPPPDAYAGAFIQVNEVLRKFTRELDTFDSKSEVIRKPGSVKNE